MNHSTAGIRTVFLPCRPDLGFVSSRFIREIAAHGGAIDHLVAAPVAAALAGRFSGPSPH
jgi:pantetheine-phosphate adenylyltransferase